MVSELRLAGASTLDEANQVLWDFLPRYSQRFSVPAAQPGSAYRKPEETFIPEEVFCFKYYRRVGTDNVVRFGRHRLQIIPCNGRLSYARAKVEVHERMDGRLAVYYKGHCLATKPVPPEAPLLRVRNIDRVIPSMTNSEESLTRCSVRDEHAVPIIAVKKPSQPKTPWKPGPDHPWRRPFKVHIDRG